MSGKGKGLSDFYADGPVGSSFKGIYPALAMIHYRVSYENPLTFYLQIELTLDVAADAQAPLLEPLDRVLHTVGCQLLVGENASASEGPFGFRTVVKNERTEVTAIWPGSPAAAALTVDDEIVAVNGRRVDMNLQILLSTDATAYEVSVFRQNRLLTVTLAATPGVSFGQRYAIDKLETADAAQQRGYQQWLGWEF